MGTAAVAAAVVGLGLLVSGCCGGSKSSSSSGSAPAQKTEWKGDAKACAAVKACCSSPKLSLFCTLSQASSQGDCAKSLTPIRNYVKESKTPAPAGCM
jgi:hypothetical protein